jgi:hypothetical protein
MFIPTSPTFIQIPNNTALLIVQNQFPTFSPIASSGVALDKDEGIVKGHPD